MVDTPPTITIVNPVDPGNPLTGGSAIDLGIRGGSSFTYTWRLRVTWPTDELVETVVSTGTPEGMVLDNEHGWIMSHNWPPEGVTIPSGAVYLVTMTFFPGSYDPDGDPVWQGYGGGGLVFDGGATAVRIAPGESASNSVSVSARGYGGWVDEYALYWGEVPPTFPPVDVAPVDAYRFLSPQGIDTVYFEAEEGQIAGGYISYPSWGPKVSTGVLPPFYSYDTGELDGLITFIPTDAGSYSQAITIEFGDPAANGAYPQSSPYESYTVLLRGNYIPEPALRHAIVMS
mgnify:CR=1 FL=1